MATYAVVVSGICDVSTVVLVHDAAVLHWHGPIAKGDHLCAEPHMFVIERRGFLRGVCHERHRRRRVPSVNQTACACVLVEARRAFSTVLAT